MGILSIIRSPISFGVAIFFLIWSLIWMLLLSAQKFMQFEVSGLSSTLLFVLEAPVYAVFIFFGEGATYITCFFILLTGYRFLNLAVLKDYSFQFLYSFVGFCIFVLSASIFLQVLEAENSGFSSSGYFSSIVRNIFEVFLSPTLLLTLSAVLCFFSLFALVLQWNIFEVLAIFIKFASFQASKEEKQKLQKAFSPALIFSLEGHSHTYAKPSSPAQASKFNLRTAIAEHKSITNNSLGWNEIKPMNVDEKPEESQKQPEKQPFEDYFTKNPKGRFSQAYQPAGSSQMHSQTRIPYDKDTQIAASLHSRDFTYQHTSTLNPSSHHFHLKKMQESEYSKLHDTGFSYADTRIPTHLSGITASPGSLDFSLKNTQDVGHSFHSIEFDPLPESPPQRNIPMRARNRDNDSLVTNIYDDTLPPSEKLADLDNELSTLSQNVSEEPDYPQPAASRLQQANLKRLDAETDFAQKSETNAWQTLDSKSLSAYDSQPQYSLDSHTEENNVLRGIAEEEQDDQTPTLDKTPSEDLTPTKDTIPSDNQVQVKQERDAYPSHSFSEPEEHQQQERKENSTVDIDIVSDYINETRNSMHTFSLEGLTEESLEKQPRASASNRNLADGQLLKTNHNMSIASIHVPGSSHKLEEADIGLEKTLSELKSSLESMRVPKIWQLPEVERLHAPDRQENLASYEEYNQKQARRITEKLLEFNIPVEVRHICRGSAVTRFSLLLAPGVRVSRIVTIAKDLARALHVAAIRVVEVLPGTPYIGIEVPNPHRSMVYFKHMLKSDAWTDFEEPLALVLGETIEGNSLVYDLAQMPHLLIGGTTGSGKSVTLNAMLLGLLMRNSPRSLRLILIDPKGIELTPYRDLPHLLTPPVTDMDTVERILMWAINEMEYRYKLMNALEVRNLQEYNQKLEEIKKIKDISSLENEFLKENGLTLESLDYLEFISLVVDEYADMIMVLGKKVEELITRLAQKARASGIHIILATQRPTADVVTGLIKANIPSRLALSVASRIDSMTIINQNGAESLLGKGDMLFLPVGSSSPHRIVAPYVTEADIAYITDTWKEQGTFSEKNDILEKVGLLDATPEKEMKLDNGDEALIEAAMEVFTQENKVTISLLQRRLSLGFNRACRIVELMEAKGLVSAPDQSNKRRLLVD